MCAFLLSLFIGPSLALEVVSMVSCHQEKRSPLSVSEPPLLAGYLQPQRTARSRQCVEEVSGEWGFSWFKIWLPKSGTPETSIPWLSWAFLPSSTPGRKPGPARVDMKSLKDSLASVSHCKMKVAIEACGPVPAKA